MMLQKYSIRDFLDSVCLFGEDLNGGDQRHWVCWCFHLIFLSQLWKGFWGLPTFTLLSKFLCVLKEKHEHEQEVLIIYHSISAGFPKYMSFQFNLSASPFVALKILQIFHLRRKSSNRHLAWMHPQGGELQIIWGHCKLHQHITGFPSVISDFFFFCLQTARRYLC